MALYSIVLAKSVRKKDLPKVPLAYRLKILKVISGLADEPRPLNSLRLTNREEYRIRVGIYRILYVIDDEVRIVEVTNVKHRGEVYK
jgi:mRNA interferase RelE/StbE